MKGKEIEVTRLRQRQKGIEHQLKLEGCDVRVYDYRERFTLEDLMFKKSKEGFMYVSDGELSYNLPIFLNYEPANYIVSANFPPGFFKYSNYGGTESDEQFVGVITSKVEIQNVMKQLESYPIKGIDFGKIISPERLFCYLRRLENDEVKSKIETFYSLPKKFQREVLDKIYRQSGGLK